MNASGMPLIATSRPRVVSSGRLTSPFHPPRACRGSCSARGSRRSRSPPWFWLVSILRIGHKDRTTRRGGLAKQRKGRARRPGQEGRKCCWLLDCARPLGSVARLEAVGENYRWRVCDVDPIHAQLPLDKGAGWRTLVEVLTLPSRTPNRYTTRMGGLIASWL